MRFIHIADVHLGMQPDAGFPWSEERGEAIWESFRRIIRLEICFSASRFCGN